jgi:hypothetical protein
MKKGIGIPIGFFLLTLLGTAFIVAMVSFAVQFSATAQTTGDECVGLDSTIIDIVPGNDFNIIHEDGFGWTSVALFSRKDFDAPNCIALNTFTFGRTGDENSLRICGEVDVNLDKFVDVLCDFVTLDTNFIPGDTQGILKGLTIQSDSFQFSDSVNIIQARADRQICCGIPVPISSATVKSKQLNKNNYIFLAQGDQIDSMQVQIYSIAGESLYNSGVLNRNRMMINLRSVFNTRTVANGVYIARVTIRDGQGNVISHAFKKLAYLR